MFILHLCAQAHTHITHTNTHTQTQCMSRTNRILNIQYAHKITLALLCKESEDSHRRTRRGREGGGGGRLCPPPPQKKKIVNVKIRAKLGQNLFGYNLGKYSGDFLLLLPCQNMLSGILGACMYPYADTGIEDRKFWGARKCSPPPPPPSARFSGLARIRAWILQFGQNMPKMCISPI